MRFNPYDDVMVKALTTTSVAISSFTGSTAVTSDAIDTAQVFPAESILLHIRTELDTGGGSASTLAWALQESVDGSTNWTAARDNAGVAIGATVNNHTVASDIYARIEGINLTPALLATNPQGGRARYLRVVITPAGTGVSSPTFLAYAEFIGVPASGQSLPVRTAVSNT
jgi:hypothetical protein